MLRFAFTIIVVLSFTKSFAFPFDSLGCEKKGGKVLVLHKVEEGQSLFSILQRYNSTKTEFYAANPDLKINQKLVWEQIIKVPYHKPKRVDIVKAKISEIFTKPLETPKGGKVDSDGIEVVDIPEATPKDSQIVGNQPVVIQKTDEKPITTTVSNNIHVVVSGENLFVISKKYNLKTWQIRLWNNLPNDNLRIGQKLFVTKPANFVAVKPKIVTKKDTLKPKVVQAPAGDISKPSTKPITKPNQPVPNAPGGRKMTEQGIAEALEGGDQSTKFLALHRTAPVGTLIIVKNESNGQSVWVKVVGKISGGSDALIRISPKAFEKLQSKDKRIRASLSYTLK